MKKASAYSIILCLILFCSLAYAEVFSVRNNICFGMSVDEVKAAEGNLDILRWDWTGEKYHNSLEYWYLPIAGIEGSSLEYKFDLESDLLYEIVYAFETNEAEKEKKHVLEQMIYLYNYLTDKYGEPLHDGDGGLFPSCTDEFSMHIGSVKTGICTISAYAEWLIPYEDYWVVVDLVTYGTGYPKIDSYQVFLAYKQVSNEIVDRALQDYNDEQVERQAQIDKDL